MRHPAAGAFASPQQPMQPQAPQAQPQPGAPPGPPQGPPSGPAQGPPQDPAAFLAQIQQQLAALGPPPQLPPQMAPPQPQQAAPDPMAALAAMAGQQGAKPPHQHPPRPTKRQFVPGQPGKPRSGMTAHEMMRDESIVSDLASKVAAWERENPGRTLKGPHIQAMLPDVSASQARTLKRLLERMTAQESSSPDDTYNAAAYAAMGGRRG